MTEKTQNTTFAKAFVDGDLKQASIDAREAVQHLSTTAMRVGEMYLIEEKARKVLVAEQDEATKERTEAVERLVVLRARFNDISREYTALRARETLWFNERMKLIEENTHLKELAANLEAQRDEKAGQVKRLVDGSKLTNAQHDQLKKDYERLDAGTASMRANSIVLTQELGCKVSALEKELAAVKRENTSMRDTVGRCLRSEPVTVATTLPEERLLELHALAWEKVPEAAKPLVAFARVLSGEWEKLSLNQRLRLIEMLSRDTGVKLDAMSAAALELRGVAEQAAKEAESKS